MGKQPRWKRTENLGKGKVTPIQVAFIVDRYLSDNNFSDTRSSFRSEASSLLSKSPVQEAPKSLLSLGAMLNEYISLKEQRVFIDQEKCRLEQEKLRVQALLQGLQDVMNTYNTWVTAPPLRPPLPPPNPIDGSSGSAPNSMAATLRQTDLSTAGYSLHNIPTTMSTSGLSNVYTDTTNSFTPITSHAASKRRGSQSIAEASVTAKKSRRLSPTISVQVKDSNTLSQPSQEANCQHNSPIGSQVQLAPDNPDFVPAQGTSVSKCLFNLQIQSPPSNSSGPKTPARPSSSQTEKSISPPEISSTATSGKDVSPLHIKATNFTVISSETIKVSPTKQVAYYAIERNHCISTSSPVKENLKKLNKRDFVKGRLDFDGSDMKKNLEPLSTVNAVPESDKGEDIFDLDLLNLDCMGVDFSLPELLLNLDADRTENDSSFWPPINSSSDSPSGSPHKSVDINFCGNRASSKFSSTVAETTGPECLSSVSSITKCFKILSPVKIQSFSEQENLTVRNCLGQ